MAKAQAQTHVDSQERWLWRWTTLGESVHALFDPPSASFSAWARTTAGVVAMLLALQIMTGTLLAFYYVPSTESAHTTVAYIEKVLPAGSWIRALHHYGSQWLTLFLVLHLAQMFWRAAYKRGPTGWIGSVVLLALVFAGGAVGYSLPWDARAFFSTRVAEGIAGGLPFLGATMRRWLLGGEEISALTLARFYALHVLVVPALIIFVVIARLFIFRERGTMEVDEEQKAEATGGQKAMLWRREQFTRNVVAAGLVFLALALYAAKFHAPFGPTADAVAPGYLPRPGAQFLWLFQTLKYLPGRPGVLIALMLPTLIFAGLAALPFLNKLRFFKTLGHSRRNLGASLFTIILTLFALMTALAYIEDARDPRTRAQLAHQASDEAAFRAAPFEPQRLRPGEADANDSRQPPGTGSSNTNASANSAAQTSARDSAASSTGPVNASSSSPPDAYLKNCANCHGTRGQGFSIFPKLINVSSKPHRTVEDIIALLDDPVAYGLKPPMKSFTAKLSDDEKRDIAVWVVSLKKGK